jgi:hypothetical protein
MSPGAHGAASPRGARQLTRHAVPNKVRAAEQVYCYIRVAKNILPYTFTVKLGQKSVKNLVGFGRFEDTKNSF